MQNEVLYLKAFGIKWFSLLKLFNVIIMCTLFHYIICTHDIVKYSKFQ